MNKIKDLLIILTVLLTMSCCKDSSTKTTPQEISIEKSNKDYDVVLLFEIDGIKVYKFMDNGRVVYFSNSQGRVDYKTTTHYVQHHAKTNHYRKIVRRHTTLTN